MRLLVFALVGIWPLLIRLGGLGQILVGIVDASVIPTPGGLDILTILLAAHSPSWWPLYGLMAVIGSDAGGYITYRIGRKGGQEALDRRFSEKQLKRVSALFEKYSWGAITIPAMLPPPVPISPFLIAAGAMKVSEKKFLASFTLGRAIRYFTVAYLGSRFGRQMLSWISRFHQPILIAFVTLCVIAGIALLVHWRKGGFAKRVSKKDQDPRKRGRRAA